jgi:hypothetical protein
MNCALSKEDELSFLALVYKELEVKAAAGEAVDIEKHIQDFYNEALAKSKDKAKALTYAQILPEFMLAAYSNKRAKLKATKLDLNKLDEIIDLFENIDEVGKYVTPEVSNTVVEDASNLAKEKAKQPKKKEETLKEKATKILAFMFKPQTPLSTTGQQGTKTDQLSDTQVASIIRTSLRNVPTAADISKYRRENVWSNIKNKNEDFYYDFFNIFSEALDDYNSDPSKTVINGHTGFKIKLINKTQIPIEKAKQDEQNFAASVGIDAYNKGTAAVVSDNEGNILYFDKDYNIVSEEVGLPIYHNIRKIKLSDSGVFSANGIQSPQEIAKNTFEPTLELPTLDALQKADPILYAKYVSKAEAELQIQLKAMYDLRTYLLSDNDNSVIVDIAGISRGIVDVNQNGQAKWTDIDWAGSDVQSNSDNTIVATRTNPALGEVEGTAYLRVPGNKSIELQKDNISQEDVEKLVSLLVDDVKEIRNKREVSVPFDTKMKLFRSFSLEYTQTMGGKKTQSPIQFVSATEKILLNGTDITTLDNARELIKQVLTTPTRKGSYYNTKFGQYAFKGTDVQGDFVDFSIKNGILSEEPVTVAEHIRAHSTLKVIPNETNQIVYLNGYFTFDMPDFSLPEYQPKTESEDVENEVTVINEVSESSEKSKLEKNPMDVVKENNAIFRGVSLLNQYVVNEDGSITLYAQKNFSGKQSGISFTPYLDTAFDYARRSKSGTSKKTKNRGIVIKVTDPKFLSKSETEAYDEVSYVGGDLKIPKGSYEIINGVTKDYSQELYVIDQFLQNQELNLQTLEASKLDKTRLLRTLLQQAISLDEKDEYTENENRDAYPYVDNAENRAIVSEFGAMDPNTAASHLIVQAFLYKFYIDNNKDIAKIKSFLTQKNEYDLISSGLYGDMSYEDAIDNFLFTKDDQFNKLSKMDVSNTFKLNELDFKLTETSVTKEETIEDKIAALEAAEEKPDSDKPRPEQELYRSRLLKMDSTPKQRADAKAWFLSSPLSKYIGYKEMFDVINSNGWASFKDGAITLYAGSDSTALYHEAWHAFSQHFLNKADKMSLYGEVSGTAQGKAAIKAFAKQIKKNPLSLTEEEVNLALEELIAEDFRKFVMSDGKKVLDNRPQRNTLFRRILNALKRMLGYVRGVPYTSNNTFQLTELFNKLYVGEVNEYTPDSSNAYFKDTLYKSYDETVTNQDSKKIVDSMDAIMSEFMDLKNAQLGNTKWSNAIYNGNPKLVDDLYLHTKNALRVRALEMYREARELTGTDKENKLKNADKLHKAWVKFGDNIDGLWRFHMDNSPLISNEVKDIDQEAFTKAREEGVTASFDKATNSMSLTEYSSNQVLALVRGLKKYENGKVVYNEFGFPELAKWQTIWKTLISTLADSNQSPATMKAALEEIAPLTPWAGDLLAKLGPTDSPHHSVQDLWTGFWSAFFMSHERLYDILINEEFTENEDGAITGSTFEVLAGYASAVFRKAELDFRSHFKISNHPNPFIKDTPKLGNILDLQGIINKFGKKSLTSNKEKYDFITSIGIPISENNDIINGLSDVNAGAIYDKLVILHKHKYLITDIIKTLKENVVLEDKKETDKSKSEATNINKILNLEAKFSGNYSNASVMTVEGKVAHEQTQMATLSRMVKMLNDSESFQELIEIPSMSFLDPKYNDSVEASNIIKSLYDKNGKRRKGVKITIDNLDGTQNMTNKSTADLNYSTSTSNADKYTRLQQDIYSLLVSGKASMMTPGDKGTILSFNINKLKTERSEDDHLYVDTGDFGKKGSEMNLGIEKTYGIMMPFLNGELKRIERIKSDPNMPAIDGYTVPTLKADGTVKEATGLGLGIFDDVFDSKLKAEIMGYKSVDEIPAEIQEKMMHEFQQYLTYQMKQTEDILGRVLFLDDNIKKLAEKGVGRTLNAEELKKIVIGSYTANKFINNAESLVLFFGDISQYKDFDKRNSAINSTGRMFRTDQDYYDFIKSSVHREFAIKHNGDNGSSKYAPFNGILQTAIFKDNLVDSKAYKEYLAIATKAMGKEKAEILLSPYLGMEEGDAQGWLSFDSYRILGKASNRWSDKQEELYLQILNNPETVDPLKVFEYFPARKYQYFGPLAIKGIHATAFHKYSLMPLIPTVIKGKNISKVHDMMMEQGIDYAVYRTGSKVANLVQPGTSGGDVIYKDSNNRIVDTNLQFTKNPIYLEYLKDQLDINSHFKEKVIFSTQLRKLVEEGLIENGVPVDFKSEIKDKDERKEAWKDAESKGETTPFYEKYKTYESKIEKLVHLRMAELTHETLGVDGKADMSKIVSFITRELDRQELTEHEKEFIGVDSGGALLHDLSISPSATKIENTLISIVNRRLIRQKINGEALVQISSSLFEDATNATEDQLNKYRQDELRTYILKNGKTQAMEVKVALQGNFKSLIHLQYDENSKVAVYTKREVKQSDSTTKYIKELNQEETLKRLNEVINSEVFLANEDNVKMITMVGVRIPVQGLNSMEFMRVKEFLPPSAGNIIIPPAEIVAKSGSDFDIDKLTIMMPTIAMLGGRPEILKEYNGNLTPTATVARMEELKTLIKAARTEKNTTKKQADAKFESLQDSKKLSDELVIEKAALLDPFLEASKKASRDKEKFVERITRFQGRENLSSAQQESLEDAWKQLAYIEDNQDQIDEELAAAKLKFAVSKKLINSEAVSKTAESKAYIKAMAKLDDLKREQGSLSPEAIENSIMFSIKEILEMEHNFLPLITPNDTGLVLPKAKTMAAQRGYKDTEGVWGKTKGISPTRHLEIGYNLYKHESNSIGKATLGMGAVDNTFNSIFNRIGAYMNPTYTASKHTRRATILMDHNTLKVGEERGISLSHLYDVDNANKVSDIINQLLNGWLDVAKDAWIFDLQGNKQLTPVMMFLLQAGVTFENAINFISNPIVKKYVDEQKIITSAFAKAAGEASSNPNDFRNKAQRKIFGALGIYSEVSFKTQSGESVVSGASLYKATLEKTKDIDFSKIDKKTGENIASKIAKLDDYNAMKSEDAIAAFLHYLELEKLANEVTTIKSTLNYDTSRSTTLFDAQKSKVSLDKLKDNDLFPKELIDNFFKETPVGSFNIADFQLELWSPLFSIRNNSRVNDMLLADIANFNKSKKMVKMFGSEDLYVQEFKNGLIAKMFIDEIKSFNVKNGYRGLDVKKADIETDKHLDKGVNVQDGVVYIDEYVLERQFTNNLYTGHKEASPETDPIRKKFIKDFNYGTLKLAPVRLEAFDSETGREDFMNFSIEREYLRATNPFAELSKSIYFQKTYKKNLAQRVIVDNESSSDREQRILRDTYEESLRDMALDNTLNFWKLFKSDGGNTIADQLFEIREMHPSLRDDFMIVNDFIMSEGGRKNAKGWRDPAQGFKNLTLRDNRVESDMFETYHENMVALGGNAIIPIETMADKLENTRLNEFFSRLPVVAFLQSGLDTKNSLSITRAMPSDKVTRVVEAAAKNIVFTNSYLEGYRTKFNSHNDKKNISIRKRLQNYVTAPKSNPNRSLTKHSFTIDQTMPMNWNVKAIEQIISGDVTEDKRTESFNVRKGDIIEFTNSKTDRTILVRATTDERIVSMTTKDGFEKARVDDGGVLYSFLFESLDLDETSDSKQTVQIDPANINQLESLVKNNPDVLFVLEGVETSDTMYLEGIGKVKKTDNMLPIITRIRPSGESKDLWSKMTTVQNQKYIDDSLDSIQELYDTGKKIAFIDSSKGYGSYMLDKNSQGKIIDSNTYKYLSTELLKRFGYSNRYSKIMTDTRALIKENQDFTEFSIEIPFNEIIEAQERLTCKT